MNIDWGNYNPYIPLYSGLLGSMPRRQAKEEFDHLMTAREGRSRELSAFLATQDVVLTTDDEGIETLDSWFVENVELSSDNRERLQNVWYAIAVDIGLFMGDLIISQCSHLRWEFFIWGKRNVSYQRPVIMGFQEVKHPKYNVDIILALSAYGLRVASGKSMERGLMSKMMVSMRAKA